MANYDWAIQKYAKNFPAVDPRFVKAVIQAESGGNPNATNLSSKKVGGAHGIAQLTPATAHSLGVSPYDPEQSIWATYKLVDDSLRRNNGDYSKAAAEFFAGPNPKNHGQKTKAYVAKVMDSYQGSSNPEPAFKDAFAAARAAGEDTFTWKGKSYTTQLAEETKAKPREASGTIRVTEAKPRQEPPPVSSDPLDNMPIVRQAGGRLSTGRIRGALEPQIGVMNNELQPETVSINPFAGLEAGHQAIINALQPAYNAVAPAREYVFGAPGQPSPMIGALQEMNQNYALSDKLGIPRGILDPRYYWQWLQGRGFGPPPKGK